VEDTLHKVTISEEAVFDYEHCLIVLERPSEDDLPLFRFPKEIKAELEEYIQCHSRVKHKHYFRVRHYDENLGDYLMLFVKKSWKMATMQNWTVVGICFECDWDEEAEEDGIIKNWYDTKINKDEIDKTDWVEEMRIRQEIETEENEKDEKERKRYARLFD
jgi:hypothetical protein